MEWYWAWYVLGPDTNTDNTMMTPSLFCPPVWISKGGIKKNSRNIFFKFSPNLFRKAVYIDKGWAVTFSWYLPMSLSDFTPALVWWVDYTMKANRLANVSVGYPTMHKALVFLYVYNSTLCYLEPIAPKRF